MGILADKMLSAGVVSTDDVARVKRQQTIEKENKRKVQERRESRSTEDQKKEIIRGAVIGMLLSAGLTPAEANKILAGEKVDLMTLALLGQSSKEILTQIQKITSPA